MEQRGIVHLAEMIGGLPRGRGLCGAVGTAFVVQEPLRQPLCDRCTAIAQETGDRDADADPAG